MGAFADVTSIVSANPNARFQMDNLTLFNASGSQTCNTATVYGNWALYIIYSLPTESTKTLALYDGLQYIGGTTGYASANNVSVTLSGLRIPNATAGTEKIAKTTILVSDGDPTSGASDDSLFLATDLDASFSVSNSLNPINDVFNGSITLGPTDGGTATGTTSTASPTVVGGLDFDTFDLSSRVTGGAQSIIATVDSTGGELLMLYNMLLMATNTTADLSIIKTAPATQLGGGNITYNLTASNAGPQEAYNVVVSDPLPTGVTYVSNTGGGTYNSATRTVTWNLGRMNASTSQPLSVTVSVPASNATYPNTATISSGSFDSNSANNSSSVSTTVLLPPTINKVYSPTSILGNGSASSTLTITLNNPNSVSLLVNSALTDNIGTGLTITSVTGGSCPAASTSFSGTTITYASGATIPAGGCTIMATVTSAVAGSYPNTIAAGALVTNGGTNAAAANATLTVTPVADLAITKIGPAYAKPGVAFTYTIKAWNKGPNTTTGITITDNVPSTLTAVSWTCAATGPGSACGTASGTGNSISLIPTLPVDASGATSYVTITVTATAPTAAVLESTPSARTLTNTATISSSTTDTDSTNNSASATTNTIYAKLTKSVRNVTQNAVFGTTGNGLPGELLEYCIAYANYGNTALPNFIITDNVPTNTTALLTAYDAVEPSTNTGFGVKLTRGATTSYLTSAADADTGSLNTAMTVNLGTLGVGETGSACFQATIK